MRNKLLLLANGLLALGLLWLFLSGIDVAAAEATFASVDFAFVLAAVACYLFLCLLNAYRLKILLCRVAKAARCASLNRMFWVHVHGMLLSDYTPGRVGYAFVALKTREFGVKARLGARVFGVALAADFLSRGVFFVVSLAFLLSSGMADAVQLYAVAAFLLAASFAVMWALVRHRKIVETAIYAVPALGVRLAAAYAQIFSKAIPRRLLLEAVAISFAGALVRGLEWLLLARGLGLAPVSLETLAFFTVFNSVVTVLSFVPLSVAGLGLQEGAGAFAFSMWSGVGLAETSAFMLLVRIIEAGTDLVGLKEVVRT